MNRLKKYISNFTQIPNELINDESISVQARFLFIYLNSKPDDWQFYNKQICKVMKCSRDSLAKYMNQLKEAKWINVNQINENGRFGGNQYELFQSPSMNLPCSENTDAEIFRNGKNQVHTNTDSSTNTDLKNNTDDRRNGISQSSSNELFANDSEKTTRFRDSVANNWNIIGEEFSAEIQAGIDVRRYMDELIEWSDRLPVRTKTQKDKALRTARGWIAKIRTSIRTDHKKGSLKMMNEKQPQKVDSVKAREWLNFD